MSPLPTTSPFTLIGQLSYRYRFWVLGLWVILLLGGAWLGSGLDGILKGTGTIYTGGKAAQAEQRLDRELGIKTDSLTMVLDSREALQPEASQPVALQPVDLKPLLASVKALPAVEAVDPSLSNSTTTATNTSTPSRVEAWQVSLTMQGSEAYPVIDEISQILQAETPPSVKGYLTGKDVVDFESQQISKKDLLKAEAIALPLTLVALIVIFRSLVAAVMPVALALMTVSVTSGLIYGIAHYIDVSIFAINLTTMLGLGIGIDFTLVMVSRFREELPHHDVAAAVVRTVETAGEAVFYSGLTTCIGLFSLLLFPVVLLQSLGVAGSLVILMSILAALSLVPALLGVLGPNINRWRVLSCSPQRCPNGFWATLTRQVIRFRVPAAAAVVALIMALASPFSQASWGIGDVNILPASTQARQGVEVLEDAVGPGQASPIWLVVSSDDPAKVIWDEAHSETVDELVHQLETDERIARVQSRFNFTPQLDLAQYQQPFQDAQQAPPQRAIAQVSSDTTTLIAVSSKTNSNHPQSRALVQDLRQLDLPGLSVMVGGATATQLDTLEVIAQRFPWAFGAIMLVTFVSLFWLFGSVLLPLKAIFFNVMSIAASFGALVFVFQQGHFQHLLNFTPVGYLDILLPVVLFCVLFGLSMDYEVFLLSRMKEAYDRTGNNSTSIVEGMACTGRIITSSALLTMIVTGAFAMTSIIFVKALGLGVAISVLIDATLVRAILVPASMKLMGRWNWWAPEPLCWLRQKLLG
ncbi:MAG: MMPL family transporter [Elainellaceae cyanobacterium]